MRTDLLQSSGMIREICFHSDGQEAVLMLECLGVEEENPVLSTLPLVKIHKHREL